MPSIIGLGFTLFLVFLIFAFFGIRYGKRGIFYFGLGFLCHALSILFELIYQSGYKAPVVNLLIRLFVVANSYFFLLGTHSTLKIKFNKIWLYLLIAVSGYTVYAVYSQLPFLWLTIPAHGLAGIATISAGVPFYRDRENPSKTIFLLFLFWGLHRLNYPFLRVVDWFAPIGFEITRVLTILIAFALMYNFLKEMERQKNAEAKKYETIFEYGPDAKFLVDFFSAHILDANYRACELLGYSKEEIRSMKPWDIGHGFDEKYIEMEREILKKDRFFSTESIVKRKDGRLIPVAVRIVKLDKQKVIVNIRDISREIEAIKALKESEKRFRSLFDNMIEGFLICEWDEEKKDFIFVDVNRSFENIFNMRKEEIKGRRFSDFQEKLNFIQSSYLKDLSYLQTLSYCCKSDDDRFYRLNFIPISEKEFVLDIFDITSIVNLEKEKKKMEKKIIQTQKLESLGVLAGGIAHDFNNILTAILGNTQLAIMSLDSGSKTAEYLRAIEKATFTAADLAKQMLAYSGKGKFIIEPISLNKLIEEIKPVLLSSINKNVALNFLLSPYDPFTEGDASQIKQVLLNLVINASEAIGDKEGIITISTGMQHLDESYIEDTYATDYLPPGDYAFFEVTDTGKGISKDLLPKIFDPFFSTKFIGRGLGLAAVLGIIRGHRGTIKVYSELHKGSSFKVFLPLKEKVALRETKKESIEEINERAITVLFIDDEPAVRDYAKRLFDRLKYRCYLASDGIEGVEILKQHKDSIDLIFLDLTMPKMSGEETYREIKKIRENIPVVLMSGYNAIELTQRLASKGFSAFMQKPFKVEEILKIIKDISKKGE